MQEDCLDDERGKVLRLLSFHGADLNAATKTGGTPAFIASENGHVDVVRALGELGADVNDATKSGATPAFIASQEGHAHVVQALHDLGAKLNKAEETGGKLLPSVFVYLQII